MEPGSFVLLCLLIFGVIVYLLPVIIAFRRRVSSRWALAFVCTFFGWTVIVWLSCLIWAATGATRDQDAFFRNEARRARFPS
jgi:heme/copper-type cytochrome/quinol oxidase subunit 1